VEAHLDGLRVAGEAGFEVALAQFGQYGGPGELFPVGTLALEGRSESLIERVLDSAERAPESWRGLFGAVGWVSADALRGRAVAWLEARTAFRRLLGVVACSLHRADPRSKLDAVLDDEPLVRRRALRLAGELGRGDLRHRLVTELSAEDAGCRFWAAWSAALLGERRATVPVLQAFAIGDGEFKWRALDLVIRLMDRDAVIAWLRELATDVTQARLVVIGTGVLGDPAVVPWLIEKMGHPALARAAGEGFSMITGAEFSDHNLEGTPPEEFAAGPTDEPNDERVAIDPDENLSWPDSAKVRAWWEKEAHRFAVGMRYLKGVPLTRESCKTILREGRQRQRRAAAYELALLSAPSHLSNWRARSSGRMHSSVGLRHYHVTGSNQRRRVAAPRGDGLTKNSEMWCGLFEWQII